ncbi:hypothetical protein Bbelb_270330 [Branchiostoma belcheri]|nr:hypothetical protein Bbelb_270330 [Branchiostoma belcheri]
MAISPSCSRSGLISRERETRPETCIGLPGPTPCCLPPEPKDPLAPSEKCGVIYKIKCEECGEVYVGETERSLGEMTSEHQKSLQQKDCKSALSQHQPRAIPYVNKMN